jgi:hypothetical protein
MLAIAVFMASDKKVGYIGTTAFIVCMIVTGTGGFDNVITLDILLLRLQETFLGIIIHALVHRFLWPSDTEEAFFALFKTTKKNLIISYEELRIMKAIKPRSESTLYPYLDNNQRIQKLYELLTIPLKGSYRLLHRHYDWRNRIKAMSVAQYYLTLFRYNDNPQSMPQQQLILDDTIKYLNKQDTYSDKNPPCPKQILDAYDSLPIDAKSDFSAKKNYRLDASKAFKAVSIFVTSLLFWIYTPIPDGSMFPMNAGIYACVLCTMPDTALKHWLWGYLLFGLLFITQYVLIIPLMTEVWQLAGFYFVNMFFIWRIFSEQNWAMHRIIGGNMLMLMTLGALHLTPVYDIQGSLTMLMHVMLSLLVIQFYTHLFAKHLAKVS